VTKPEKLTFTLSGKGIGSGEIKGTMAFDRKDYGMNKGIPLVKIAANNLRLSNTYLGAQFRRLRTKLGAPIAIKAMAAKLARLVYRILRYRIKYVDRGAAFYEAKHRQIQIKHLKWKAAKLGFKIIEAPAA
jgi:transposase